VLRYYSTRLDASRIRRDARGFVRVDAIVAKPGVYVYHQGGKAIREYLPPEEVNRADSLASVQDAPVTIRHPRNMVDASTWGSVSIGHASGPATATPEGAQATLVIARSDAQGQIGKDLVEVSRGVQVRIDETPGVTPQGEAYDRVQRDIIYNHIALGPAGWGRQGAGVSLRLDSADNEILDSHMIKITDKSGKVLEFKTDSEAQAYFDGLQARADAAPPFPPKKKGTEEDDEEEETPPKKAKKDAKDVALAAEKARADAAQARLDAIDAEAKKTARTALETSARKVLGAEAKFDGATDRAVREQVIARLDSKAELVGKTDAYVESYFDIAIKSAPASRNDGEALLSRYREVSVDGTVRKDESDKPVRPDLKMRQDANDAWKKNQGAAFSVK